MGCDDQDVNVGRDFSSPPDKSAVAGEPLSLKEQQFTKLVEMHIDQLVDEGCSCDVMNGYSCSIHKIASDLKAALASRASSEPLASFPKIDYIQVLSVDGRILDLEGISKSHDANGNEVLSIHLRASAEVRAGAPPPSDGWNPRCFCPDCHSDLGFFYNNRITFYPSKPVSSRQAASPEGEQARKVGNPEISVVYTNHKGVTAQRRIIPQSIRFGFSEWHRQSQWLMQVFDVDKGQLREFAMRDMKFEAGMGMRMTIASPATAHQSGRKEE